MLTKLKCAERIPVALCGSLFLSVCSWAETEQESHDKVEFIIVGPGRLPEYPGSEDYDIVPLAVAGFDVGGLDVEIEGLTTRLSLWGDDRFQWGVTAEVDLGRDDDVDNLQVAQMSSIDTSVNAGVFGAVSFSDALWPEDELMLRLAGFQDTSSVHDGALGRLSAIYTAPLILPWRFVFELEATYGSEDYIDTYFGVSSLDAQRSGYPAFEGGASWRDVSFNINTILFLNPRWGGYLRLGVTELLEDARQSPIVKDGETTQTFLGVGIFHRFGGGQ